MTGFSRSAGWCGTANKVIVGYTFNLKTNFLTPELVDNLSAGKDHVFRAYRLKGAKDETVSMRLTVATVAVEGENEPADD